MLLLAASWAAGLAVPHLGPQGGVAPSIALSVLVLLLREAAEVAAPRVPAGSVGWTVGWYVHAVVVLALVLVNPIACIYAFAGYIDAERFLGERAAWGGVVVTAFLCALGQARGIAGLRESPALFVALLVLNVTVAVAMMRTAVDRERNVQAQVEAAEELARLHQRNLALHQTLIAQARERGVAAERERLSREIHDTVAQGLVAVIAQLESVPASIDPAARRRVERAERAARASLAEARRAVSALASPLLDDRDLAGALDELVSEWSETHDIVARFSHDDPPVPSGHADVLVRVAQEALANVAKHSGARTAAVTLTVHDGEVRLDVGDDGAGFDEGAVTPGHGLASMRERVAAVGGTLVLETAPGEGTTVSVAVPR